MDVLVYAWSHCSFCARAKALLEEHGIPYREEVLDSRRELLRRLQTRFERKTVPLILVDGEFLGGLEELERAVEHGELTP